MRNMDRKSAISITLKNSLIKEMRSYVPQRQISKFIEELVEKEIEQKKELWAKAYREAALDAERNEDIVGWDNLVGTGEGLSEQNEY